jgi:hypothetical protein
MATLQSLSVAEDILGDFIRDGVFNDKDKLEAKLFREYQSINDDRLGKWAKKCARVIIKDQKRRGPKRKYGTISLMAEYLDKCFIEKLTNYDG